MYSSDFRPIIYIWSPCATFDKYLLAVTAVNSQRQQAEHIPHIGLMNILHPINAFDKLVLVQLDFYSWEFHVKFF